MIRKKTSKSSASFIINSFIINRIINKYFCHIYILHVKRACIHISLIFVVTKMELTTLVAQLVLKAKLWKLVKNCQTVFKLFGLFYQNVSFCGYKFFSPSSYPVNSVVSKVAPMYDKIHVFDEKCPEKMASSRQRLIEKDFAIYA